MSKFPQIKKIQTNKTKNIITKMNKKIHNSKSKANYKKNNRKKQGLLNFKLRKKNLIISKISTKTKMYNLKILITWIRLIQKIIIRISIKKMQEIKSINN